MNNILIQFFIPVIIFFLLYFFKDPIATSLKLYDTPNKTIKFHKKKTPKLGGLVLIFNGLIILYFSIIFKENIFSIETNQIDNIIDNPTFSIVRKEGNKVFVKINDGHDSNQVLTHLINNKHNIVAYNELLPSLNEIFIKLVESTHATARAFQNI